MNEVLHIDFWGGAWDMGGHSVTLRRVDGGVDGEDPFNVDDDSFYEDNEYRFIMDDERLVYHDTANPVIHVDNVERTSFCQICDIYFTDSFVEWSHGKVKFLCVPTHGVTRACTRHNSSCRRCMLRMAGYLWAFVRRRVAARAITAYWLELTYRPEHNARHAHRMATDMRW